MRYRAAFERRSGQHILASLCSRSGEALESSIEKHKAYEECAMVNPKRGSSVLAATFESLDNPIWFALATMRCLFGRSCYGSQ